MARQVVLDEGVEIPPMRTFRVRLADRPDELVVAHCWSADREVITFMKWVPANAPGLPEGSIEQKSHRGFRNWMDVEEVEDTTTSIH